TKLKAGASLLLALALLGAGAGLAARQVLRGDGSGPSPDKVLQPEAAGQPDAQDKGRTDHHGDPLPPGAVARLGTTRLRTTATNPVVAPAGRTLLSASGARTVGRWDPETGRLRDEIHLPGPASEHCWFAPDGRLVAVPEADGLGLWDVASGQRQRLLPLEPRKFMLAAFSPDGQTLATLEYETNNGTGTGHVRLWPVEGGKEKLLAELPSYAN